MKLEEAKSKDVGASEMRYQVTLATDINGIEMFWRTRVSAMSPQQALMIAKDIFKKYRGRFQDAMMREWGTSDVTPLARKMR